MNKHIPNSTLGIQGGLSFPGKCTTQMNSVITHSCSKSGHPVKIQLKINYSVFDPSTVEGYHGVIVSPLEARKKKRLGSREHLLLFPWYGRRLLTKANFRTYLFCFVADLDLSRIHAWCLVSMSKIEVRPDTISTWPSYAIEKTSEKPSYSRLPRSLPVTVDQKAKVHISSILHICFRVRKRVVLLHRHLIWLICYYH